MSKFSERGIRCRNASAASLPYTKRKALRDAYRDLIDSMRPAYFVTFNFGAKIGPTAAFGVMDGFCCRLERRALGRNWNKYPRTSRMKLIAFPEHLSSNPHWHSVVRLPKKEARILIRSGGEMWMNLAERGQLDRQLVKSRTKVRNYITKRLAECDALDHVYIYVPRARKRKSAA